MTANKCAAVVIAAAAGRSKAAATSSKDGRLSGGCVRRVSYGACGGGGAGGGRCGRETCGSDLLFDVEIEQAGRRTGGSEEERGQGGSTSSAAAVSDAFQHALQEWATPTNVFCVQVLNEVQDIKSSFTRRRSESLTPSVLAGALSELGYKASLRTSVGGKNEQLFLELHHKFVVLKIEGSLPEEDDAEIVVEPSFREQFLILNPTARYCQILGLVPEVYVGTVKRLEDLVQLLCKEMARAFTSKGRTLPPWRRSKSVISRWKPKIFKDEKIKPVPAMPAYQHTLPVLSCEGSKICSCKV